LKPGWMKNTWMDRTGVRMSQGWIFTADSLLGRLIVWAKLSCSWFVGRRIIKAPSYHLSGADQKCIFLW
jgi:sensor c-di-GMP phosphodiesterase-like protein